MHSRDKQSCPMCLNSNINSGKAQSSLCIEFICMKTGKIEKENSDSLTYNSPVLRVYTNTSLFFYFFSPYSSSSVEVLLKFTYTSTMDYGYTYYGEQIIIGPLKIKDPPEAYILKIDKLVTTCMLEQNSCPQKYHSDISSI